MTLTEFLLARIAEDEAAANAATPGPWWAHNGGVSDMDDDQWPVNTTESARDRPDRVHIAAWNPARVLAECKAKRSLIEGLGDDHVAYICTMKRWHEQNDPDGIGYGPAGSARGDMFAAADKAAHPQCSGWEDCNRGQDEAHILLTLAAVYASHPDYDQEWL